MGAAISSLQRFFSRMAGACLLWTLLCCGLPSAQAAARFTAGLDRSTIAMGESAILSLVFEGDAPTAVPVVPPVTNLQIQYTGNSRNYAFINGQATASTTLSYVVTPFQPGDYEIPAISINIGPNTVRSQPLQLRVTKMAEGSSDALSKYAFVEMRAAKTNLFVGEMVPVEIQLYVTAAEGLQLPQISAEGFVLGKMPQHSQTKVQRNNAIYNVLTFQLTATPMKTGALTLGPAEFSCTLLIPQPGQRRANNVFEDFFDGGFGPRHQKRPVVLKSAPVVMQVSPLPEEGKPANFNGAVGQYTFAASLSPTNLNAGDPITLKAQIAGTGALDSVSLPPQDSWQNFKVYPASSVVEPSNALGSAGVKTFEQVIIPQSGDVAEVPAIAFSYFDPQDRRYHTLSHAATPITVRASASSAPQPVVYSSRKTDEEEPPPATRDIVHIKTTLGALASASPASGFRPSLVLLQIIPPGLWLAALAWKKRSDMLASNPRLRRKRKVDELTSAGLRELDRLAQEQKSQEFFAALFRLLQEQIGERLDLPSSAITEAVLDREMQGAGASEALVHELRDLFAMCNQALYAPSRSQAELAALSPRAAAAIAELKRMKEPGA